MTTKHYLLLLVDREHAKFYLISGGHLIEEKELEKDFSLTLSEIEKENIPSINARIRQLKNVSR